MKKIYLIAIVLTLILYITIQYMNLKIKQDYNHAATDHQIFDKLKYQEELHSFLDNRVYGMVKENNHYLTLYNQEKGNYVLNEYDLNMNLIHSQQYEFHSSPIPQAILYIHEINDKRYLVFTDSLELLIDCDGQILSKKEHYFKLNLRGQRLANNEFVILKNGGESPLIEQLKIDVYDKTGKINESKTITLEDDYISNNEYLYLNDGSLLELRIQTVIKYDSTGEVVWKKKLGKSSIFHHFNEMIETKDGYIMIIGHTSNYRINSNAYVLQLNPGNGKIIWDHYYAFEDLSFQFNHIKETEEGYLLIGNLNERFIASFNYQYYQKLVALNLSDKGKHISSTVLNIDPEKEEFHTNSILILNQNDDIYLTGKYKTKYLNEPANYFVLAVENDTFLHHIKPFNMDLYLITRKLNNMYENVYEKLVIISFIGLIVLLTPKKIKENLFTFVRVNDEDNQL